MSTYIYILTDCNRTYLHVGMADDLSKAANTYARLSGLFFDACSKVSRLVYHEKYPSEEVALARFNELSKYTRMQKERLIRKHNPNWVNLGPTKPLHGLPILNRLNPAPNRPKLQSAPFH